MNAITKKNPTTTNTPGSTSYLSMVTPNVVMNNNNKRRESSTGEDSGVQIDHDSTEKNLRSTIVPSLSSSLTSKTIGITTAPNPHSVSPTTSSSSSISNNNPMVASSALVPPSIDSSSTLVSRKTSNASSSGAYSELSRSFGHDENSSDSLYGITSSSSSSHYVIKCNLNTTTTTSTTTTTNPNNPRGTISSTTTTAARTSVISPSSMTLTPRVKVTVQQPSITTRSSHIDSSTESLSSSSGSHLKTPTNIPINTLPIMTTSIASSAPEFSLSGASSIDDSDDLANYEQYLLTSHSRQSNPSPEMRKKKFDDWTASQEQRYLPRSKSEVHTPPIQHEQHQQSDSASQVKTVG